MYSSQTVSLVIRVRNAEKDLQRCLRALVKQVLPAGWQMEIVVVNNDSVDGSEQVAKDFDALVEFLGTKDFSWGRALNFGIARASGGIVAILSADAYPANTEWLAEMIRPFDDARVAAVYGRQLPREDAPLDEMVRLKKTFGRDTIVLCSIPKDKTRVWEDIPVSNACCAIRRNVWEGLPYDEEISGGEEGVWTQEVLNKGLSVVYQANACVYHSHKDTFLRSAWRHLELLKKNTALTGKKVTLFTYVYCVLSKAKARIHNVVFPGIGLGTRMRGLAALPIEMCLFMTAAAFFHRQGEAGRYRKLFWDN
jgi:rhamnosyltransferase